MGQPVFLFPTILKRGPKSINSLDGDFVHDDVEAVLRNPDVTAPDQRALADVFANDFWGSPMASNLSHKSYRPLTTLLFR